MDINGRSSQVGTDGPPTDAQLMPPPPNRLLSRTATPYVTLDQAGNIARALQTVVQRGEGLGVDSPKRAKKPNWDSYFDTRENVEVPGRGSFQVYRAGKSGPVLFCLHGGGYTGLTWACMVSNLPLEQYQVVAMDMRGHGGTVCTDNTDYSVETLSKDVVEVARALYGPDGTCWPKIVLVGHSMGGALVAHIAASEEIHSLAAVVVIDVVEGTAMESLPHMKIVLEQRPRHFPSVEEAVCWALSHHVVQSEEAALISMPSQLRPATPPGQGFVWRTPLEDTCPYWEGWFKDLSRIFLSARVPKLLVLAGTDRLDTPLNIAQMQGKFQLALIPAGHCIQEDEPFRLAEMILNFFNCFRLTTGGEKVGIPSKNKP
uniref:protein phosphatase methylesterase-1 n=1 Tax=Pyramimonas obovata TaxID=1411642 RepID=A0A7S0R4Y3_9CHLO|mmetsp:Transcript_25952/g.56298  ORF Transcript_25952/g.56298 Transcript_25952/m.56298 type:complete len:373 (+) Transcript_25952:190-1308(+)